MASTYPGTPDSFNEPTEPEGTPLSEAGTGTRNHFEHHRDLGDAVEKIEDNASLKGHDHSGDGSIAHGFKLPQVNTHESVDTDTVGGIHRTVGFGHEQAARGDHVHHYAQILDTPYRVCTSLTRPTQPFVGMMIYETDTNTVRVWGVFPTNPLATGIIVSDNFHRDSPLSLGDTLWEQHYFHDVSFGIWSVFAGNNFAWWTPALTTSNWCLARRSDENALTDTDDQEMTVTWGAHDFDHHHSYGDVEASCNDHFFRMSDDHLHYVRVGIFYGWAVVYYTLNGPAAEVVLGTLFLPVWEANIVWTISLIDWGVHLSRNGIVCGSVVDTDHHHHRDASHRGWGFGTHVVGWAGGQYRAPNILECKIKDAVSYTPAARWGLLPVASVPILIAEAQARQQIIPTFETVMVFGNTVYDWQFGPMMEESDTDILITEPGVYHVHASIAWDPGFTFQDQSMIGVLVNGQDIGRKHWEFLRGYSFFPGFSQTQEINFWYRLNAGDRVNVVAKHNGQFASFTWYDLNAPDHQVCHVELVFHTP